MTKSEEKNTSTEAVAGKAAASSIQPGTYTLDEILNVAEAAFKVMPEVIAGALQHKYEGKKDRFTKSEVRAAIEAFKKKGVKQHVDG